MEIRESCTSLLRGVLAAAAAAAPDDDRDSRPRIRNVERSVKVRRFPPPLATTSSPPPPPAPLSSSLTAASASVWSTEKGRSLGQY